jgi:3-oxoadipate enol-lactonase
MDLRPLLGHIDSPTLAISGADELAAPPDHQQQIAQVVPGARYEVVAAAHIATVERSDEVNSVMFEHLLGAT